MSIELSEDQCKAFESVVEALAVDGSVVTLVGPAGSGKTTLVNAILAELGENNMQVVLGAPTGKAALRMSEVTGVRSSTIHKLLYGSPEEVDGDLFFTDPHQPCQEGDRVVLDEASMISESLYAEFQEWTPNTASVLYIGDKEQLEPVKGSWGPDLDNPTAELTQVHRQALGSPIIDYATWIRNGRGHLWAQECYDEEDERVQVYDGLSSASEWLCAQRDAGVDATLLCYTNATRRSLNRVVREGLGLTRGSISVGDRLVVKSNHAGTGLRNGELLTVTDVQFTDSHAIVHTVETELPIFVNMRLLEESAGDFWSWKKSQWSECKAGRQEWGVVKNTVHVWYGQALTVHSAQGSQWDNVGFVWDKGFLGMQRRNHTAARRLLYTAVTRAASKLALFV